MLFNQGDWVQFKSYYGRIFFAFEYNKTYMVELYNYKGHAKIHKQIDEFELSPYIQLSITANK